MTLEEIAKLASVSKGTVSKIINKKDSEISSATRERVLAIIREHNIIPNRIYARENINSNIIAMIVKYNDGRYKCLLERIIKASYDKFIIIKMYNNDNELDVIIKNLENTNIKNIVMLGNKYISNKNLKVVNISDTKKFNMEMSRVLFYRKSYLAKEALKYLVNKNHRRIASIIGKDGNSIISGFNSYKTIDLEVFMEYIEEKNLDIMIDKIIKEKISAIIVTSNIILNKITDLLPALNLKIGEDISILFIESDEICESERIDKISVPYDQIINDVVNIFRNDISFEIKEYLPQIYEKSSISNIQFNLNTLPISVVGSINMDTTIEVSYLPQSGEVQLVKNTYVSPGGKATNQSIALSKLGCKVNIIGNIGKDADGILLYNFLKEKGVGIKNLKFDNDNLTGKAYITLQDNGDSSVLLYKGANNYLLPDFINDLLPKSFLILSMEINEDITKFLVKEIKKKDIKLVVKPSILTSIPIEIFRDVYMLIPNENELKKVVKQGNTIYEKAKYLLDLNVKYVIVTRGEKGCVLYTKNIVKEYKAQEVDVKDTTGGADAFISTLVYCLNNGDEIDTAIKLAIYSSGMSVKSYGTIDGLITIDVLNIFREKILSKEG